NSTRMPGTRDLRPSFSFHRALATWRSESIPALHEKYGDRRRFAGVCCFRRRRLFARRPKPQVKVDLEFPGREADLLAQLFIACAREVIKSITGDRNALLARANKVIE